MKRFNVSFLKLLLSDCKISDRWVIRPYRSFGVSKVAKTWVVLLPQWFLGQMGIGYQGSRGSGEVFFPLQNSNLEFFSPSLCAKIVTSPSLSSKTQVTAPEFIVGCQALNVVLEFWTKTIYSLDLAIFLSPYFKLDTPVVGFQVE